MGKELVVFASRRGFIGGVDDSEELVLFNMDTGEKEVIANPYKKGFMYLEEFFEERDPSILFVDRIDEELQYMVEENGVHVVIYPSKSIDEAIHELFVRG